MVTRVTITSHWMCLPHQRLLRVMDGVMAFLCSPLSNFAICCQNREANA
jgi:hypothetical protein